MRWYLRREPQPQAPPLLPSRSQTCTVEAEQVFDQASQTLDKNVSRSVKYTFCPRE